MRYVNFVMDGLAGVAAFKVRAVVKEQDGAPYIASAGYDRFGGHVELTAAQKEAVHGEILARYARETK